MLGKYPEGRESRVLEIISGPQERKINCNIVYFITYTIENVLKYLILTRYSFSSYHSNFVRLQSFFLFSRTWSRDMKIQPQSPTCKFFKINFVSKNFKHNKGTRMALNNTQLRLRVFFFKGTSHCQISLFLDIKKKQRCNVSFCCAIQYFIFDHSFEDCKQRQNHLN